MKDLSKVLGEIKTASESKEETVDAETYDKIMLLADQNYQPAVPFFLNVLNDAGSSWRRRALQALSRLGKDNPSVLGKVREILLVDKDQFIRSNAASVLSQISKWPDPALRQCLMVEQERSVRVSAARAILTLAHVNPFAVDMEIDRMRSGEIEPEFAEIERITQADADGDYKHLT